MPHKKSVAKRIRQAQKARLRNKHYRSMMKTWMKKVFAAQDKATAEPLARKAISVIDKVAAKGIIHRNRAARHKAQVMRHFNRLP